MMDKVVVKDQRLSELKCKLANDLAALCKPGLVFYLYGNVGSGKTTLVRAILQNLGCSQKVQSPSYAIMNVYELFCPIIHVDLYRFSAFDAPELLMLDEYLDEGIYFIEWPEHAANNILPEPSCTIKIIAHDNQARSYEISSLEPSIISKLYKYS